MAAETMVQKGKSLSKVSKNNANILIENYNIAWKALEGTTLDEETKNLFMNMGLLSSMNFLKAEWESTTSLSSSQLQESPGNLDLAARWKEPRKFRSTGSILSSIASHIAPRMPQN